MNFLNNITLRKKVNRCDLNTSNVSQESTDTFEDTKSKTKSTEDEHSSSSLTIDGANNDSMPEYYRMTTTKYQIFSYKYRNLI